MKEKLEQIITDAEAAIRAAQSLDALEQVEQDIFGRKSGSMTNLMKSMKDLSETERREMGKAANGAKEKISSFLQKKREQLESSKWETLEQEERIDVTQPLLPKRERGHVHPLTQALWKLEDVARGMGFMIEDGPELESDYFVFQALNIPEHHPARDSQDTFYIKNHPAWCMRPHVSNQQVRLMKKHGAPIRVAYPGRVFRNEAVDATHEHTFQQFEALMVDKNISVSHLIGIMKELVRGLYGKEMNIRFRPGYFPFVEPGFEMDIEFNGKWLEMLGCGLIHPEVLKAAGLDPNEYQGLAFGIGLDRMVMIKHGIEDVRHLRSGDMRFLEQF